MIPIKNFRHKKVHLAKCASAFSKDAEIIKHFRMPVIDQIKAKKSKKKKK